MQLTIGTAMASYGRLLHSFYTNLARPGYKGIGSSSSTFKVKNPYDVRDAIRRVKASSNKWFFHDVETLEAV